MPVTTAAANAAAEVEKSVAERIAACGYDRHDALTLISDVLAHCIAEDVIEGHRQWESRIERYKYAMEQRAIERAKIYAAALS